MKFALAQFCVAVSAATAALAADGTLTSREVVIPDGYFDSHDGRPGSVEGSKVSKWRLTAANAARMIALLKRVGRDLQVDYDHASENPDLKAEGRAPASGWIKFDTLTYEPGRGLIADITWTAAAAAKIVAKEMRFLSPVFYWSRDTGDVLLLKSVALTNDPATNLPVSAALTADALATLARDLELPEDQPRKGVRMDKTLLCLALGIAASATDESVLTAVSAMKAKADKADQAPDPTQYVALATLTAEQNAHNAVKLELATLKAEAAKTGIADAITKAKAEGVAMTEAYEAHLTSVGTTMGLKVLTDMLAAAPRDPAKAGKTQTGGAAARANDGGALTELTESQKSMAAMLGLDHKAYLAQLNTYREQGLEV